jgi:DNA-binding MarR family transcriptional regulator
MVVVNTMKDNSNSECDKVNGKLFIVLPMLKREIDRDVVNVALKEKGADFALHHLLIMYLLEESGERYITEIAENMGIAKAQMTQSIDKLVKLGLVKRQADSQDRRKINITLRQEGKQTLNKINLIIEQKMKDKLATLTQAELEKLSDSLQYIIDVFAKL